MLPFSIFLFLLFSATLLAPLPPVLVDSFKISTLQAFEWSSLPAPIPTPAPLSAPEDTESFFLSIPSVTLNALPTQWGPTSVRLASNTVPHSFAHTDDRTSSTAVLLVVSLAMFNCLVYKLLVDESDETRDAEGKSEQLTYPLYNPATPPPQPPVREIPLPFPSVDTVKPISESLDHESLPYSVKSPSTPFFATTILHQSSTTLGQSLLFPVISNGFSPEKTKDGDSSPSTLPASGSTLIDDPSAFTIRSIAVEAPDPFSVEPAVRFGDSKEELPESTPQDGEAATEPTSPLENACELSADEQEVFCYQPSKPESDVDEALECKGVVDCAPEAPKTPPPPANEERALPLPQLRLRSRSRSLDYALSSSAKKSTSEVIDTRLPSPRFSLPPSSTSKDQSKGEIASITRCASADDLVSMFETSNAAHASIITDRHGPILRSDILDDNAHNQVTTLSLSSLRVDAPIFKPLSSGMNEVVSLGLVSVGLEASIHVPRNEEISQTQGRVDSDVSESMDTPMRACAPATTSNTPGRPVETGSFQASIDAVEEAESSGSGRPTRSTSPRVTSGLYASIHAPHWQDPSTGTLQELGDNIEKESAHAVSSSNSTENATRRGLYASIHAPAASQSAQRSDSPKHHTDVPNWAAICRAERSSSGLPAQRGGDSSDSALDEGTSELSTTTRCATSDQEGSSVDDSDESSLVHADNQGDKDITIGSGEMHNTLGEEDDPSVSGFSSISNEQDSANTKQPRRARRRGGARRSRKKMPYVPPPRMQSLSVTQHPVIDVRAQGPVQEPNVLAAPPASLSGPHYTHPPPAPLYHPTSGFMTPPNGNTYDRFGRYPPYYPGSPHVAPIPGFQPPVPQMAHNPRPYPLGPHPQYVSPHPPSALLYGR